MRAGGLAASRQLVSKDRERRASSTRHSQPPAAAAAAAAAPPGQNHTPTPAGSARRGANKRKVKRSAHGGISLSAAGFRISASSGSRAPPAAAAAASCWVRFVSQTKALVLCSWTLDGTPRAGSGMTLSLTSPFAG